MEIERQNRALTAILEVSQAMSAEASLDRLLHLIVEKTAEIMEADRCSLFLYNESKNELWSKIAGQLSELKDIRFPVGVGIAGYVAMTRRGCNVADAYTDPRCRSLGSVPPLSRSGWELP